MLKNSLLHRVLAGICMVGLFTAPLFAQQAPDKPSAVAEKIFRDAALDIQAVYATAGELPTQARADARAALRGLDADNSLARIDVRSGRFATVAPAAPILPGNGVGNALTWSDLGVAEKALDAAGLEKAAANAYQNFLDAQAENLGLDLAELGDHRVTSHEDGRIVQFYTPRTFEGIPVRGSFLTGVANHGNLTLLGLKQWGDRQLAKKGPQQIAQDQARLKAESYLSPLQVTREWGKPERLWVPAARGNAPSDVQLGQGYAYRLAWSFKVEIDHDEGRYEVLVDAHSGQILSMQDTNHYAEAKGGVLPVTNDGIVPDGVEQAGWPMPYMDVSTSSGTVTTDTGGNLSATGDMTAALTGPYITMNDNCGSISLTQTDGLDFGTSSGTDCTTPGFGGAGNTHASRTGFFELNKIREMAKGWLPSNSWLDQQLQANMNINSTCNAYWNGTVNFYRSGDGCSNTGEIAGVFDHEWGHGMDANDTNPGISDPSGEGIADIYMALRLNTSCIGRNFRPGIQCTAGNDPCIDCTGVRDIDYLMHDSGAPHTFTWANNDCGSSVHCIGHVYSEAVWSLWKRILPTSYGYDNNTAWEIVNRLTYLGGGNVGSWFSGSPPEGGCGSDSGYMQFLAVDDDNGDLADGTPHMSGIYQAFDDQEIACSTPTVQDSGCSVVPTTAPSVTATSGNTSIDLSWGSVTDASNYEIYRTEGVFACDFGKVKVGETTGTTFTDSGLQNARDYSYVVIPKGASDACFGPASACATIAPAAAPDFTVSCSPSSLSIAQGSNDTSLCTVSSLGGYTGTVNLSCSGQPAGVTCGFSSSSVSPPADGSADSTLTLTVDLAQSTGTFNFNVVGDDGTKSKSTGIELQVVPEGQNGPQDAVYDSGLGAPACSTPGTECDSLGLLDGRASLGPEPNQPNTLDSCTDGTSGSYHSDESNDRIVVHTLDGYDFVEGATVEVDVTVWAWNDGSSDTLDLYYAADANNPSWQLIGSYSPPSGGANTITASYTLPSGSLQAIRANFRYSGSQSPCSGGSYDDADDLVFAVNLGSPECSLDSECDDGLWCNGAETCSGGACQAGTAPDCSDGVGCTVDSCDESTDSCTNTADDSLCDDGAYCNGTETCDASLDCQAGSDPCVGLFCDESTDMCYDCAPKGDSCTVDSDCCSNKCRGPSGRMTCK